MLVPAHVDMRSGIVIVLLTWQIRAVRMWNHRQLPDEKSHQDKSDDAATENNVDHGFSYPEGYAIPALKTIRTPANGHWYWFCSQYSGNRGPTSLSCNRRGCQPIDAAFLPAAASNSKFPTHSCDPRRFSMFAPKALSRRDVLQTASLLGISAAVAAGFLARASRISAALLCRLFAIGGSPGCCPQLEQSSLGRWAGSTICGMATVWVSLPDRLRDGSLPETAEGTINDPLEPDDRWKRSINSE
jgi:hypothetical protein